jgi:phosphoenolpyruvate carboxylase
MSAAQELHNELVTRLASYKNIANMFSNPIQLLALDILDRLQRKEISTSELTDFIQLLCTKNFFLKAERLKSYIGELDRAVNEREIRTAIEGLADSLSFSEFATQIEEAVFGIVITAHPTFSISEYLANGIANVVTSKKSCDIGRFLHKPDEKITLAYEHQVSMQAIVNIQEAISRIYKIVFAVAKDKYPNQWQTLTPRLMTIASWVGYDLDGRVDISWCDTLLMRMESSLFQINQYIGKLEEFKDIQIELVKTRDILENEMELLAEYIKNKDDISPLLKLTASNNDNARLTNLSAIAKRLEKEEQLFVLRAEMLNYGLGVAHIHVRVNAIQFHNAIHSKINIERLPENSAEQQDYIAALNELLNKVQPATTNLGTILQEQRSVKRLFMLLVYIFKYIDTTPIRFLIAEVENVCTILTVLYYAKLFGVEDKIDISPLFETDYGLHHGADIIALLITNPNYRAYLEKRGQLCIQTGFSDAGRYVGQLSASLALERLRMKIGRLFEQYNLSDVKLVIFDTHGESIGRGNNPKDIDARIDYVVSPTSRYLFKKLNINFKHETSFQGGDGYLYFKNKDLAFATVSRLLRNNFSYVGKEDIAEDPFYNNINYAFSFFFAIRKFHDQLFNDPDYAILLNIFRNNLIYPTGSRANKRQHEGLSGVDYAHPSQMRAIPHNAILQQLGVLINTVSGLGEIIQKDPAQFITMYKKSDRFRSLMTMVSAADQLTSFDVLDAYIALISPKYWLQRAAQEKNLSLQRSLLNLASLLEKDKRSVAAERLIRKLKKDKIKLYNVFENLPDNIKNNLFPDDYREQLDLLHAVRIALIQNIFLATTHLPRFAASPDDIRIYEVAEMILHLEILPALDILYSTFPTSSGTLNYKEFGEVTYTFDDNDSYVDEHRNLFEPIKEMYELIRQISTGISYLNGAMG